MRCVYLLDMSNAHQIAAQVAETLNTVENFSAKLWSPSGRPWARVYVKANGKDAGYIYVSAARAIDFGSLSRQKGAIRQIVESAQTSAPALATRPSSPLYNAAREDVDAMNAYLDGDESALGCGPVDAAPECLECGAVQGRDCRWVEAGGMGCSRCN